MAKRAQLSSINTCNIRSTLSIIKKMLNIALAIIFQPQKEHNRPLICYKKVLPNQIIMIQEIIRSSINKMISYLKSLTNQSLLLQIIPLQQSILFLTPLLLNLLSKIALLQEIINLLKIIIFLNPFSRHLKLIDPPIGLRIFSVQTQIQIMILPPITSKNQEP